MKKIYLIIALTLILIIVVVFYSINTSEIYPNKSNKTAQAKAPLTAIQKKQLAEGSSKSSKQKVFYITVGNYYFTPDRVVVNQGDKVLFMLNDVQGEHTMIINELNLHTPIMQMGMLVPVSFIIKNKGKFSFYSYLAEDKKMGMKGTLIVQ